MSKAEQNATTPCAVRARVLPSVLDLVVLIRAVNDRGDFYDRAKLEAKDHSSEYRHAEEGYHLAYERETALRELAMTLPAQSAGDVAGQLYLAFLELGFLEDHELSKQEVNQRVRKLYRLVAGMLPAACAAAGLTVEQIGGEYTPELVAHRHPAVEA